ncbi:MAG: hypothetical protein AMXMBFR36_31160 [Acidobacteriota bacterium]
MSAPDEAAFTRLVDAEGGRLLAFARRFCGDGRDAEDLVQETFARAFRNWSQLEDPEKARAWLYSIARRACQRMHRPRAGQPARLEPLSELEPRPGPTVPELPSAAGDPHAERLRREAREIVESALAELPDPFRQTLVLADLAELGTGEVAAVMGVKEATVKTRLHRARLKLRDVLARRLPQRPAPAPTHARRVCLDLLHAKLEALDRGVPFSYSDAALCERCSSLLGTLDLARDGCRALAVERLDPALRRRILDQADRPRRGRST